MVGYMGDVCVIMQNLKVVCIDVECGLIMVEGFVLGVKGGWILVCDVIKKVLLENVLVLGVFKVFVVVEVVGKESE